MGRWSYRRLGGWTLVANAAIGFVLALVGLSGLSRPAALSVLHLLGLLLLIFGLPAIQATQPQTGRAGQIGLGLVGLAAAIAFVIVSLSLVGAGDVASAVPFTSSLCGMVGYVLVGVLTVRAREFPGWIGWLLPVVGIIEFGTGLVSGLDTVAWINDLLGVAVIAGYGWTIARARSLQEEAVPRPA